jgi:hypothetical protein
MTLLMKDPASVLDYAIDWGAEYLDGDLLAASAWSISPEEGDGVAIVGSDFDAGTTTVKAAGGVAGRLYTLTNQVTLDSGRVDIRSIVLRVEKR